jgi:hypothetical protein
VHVHEAETNAAKPLRSRLERAAAARSTVVAKSNASEKLVTDGFRRLARKVHGVPDDRPDGGAARSDTTLPG